MTKFDAINNKVLYDADLYEVRASEGYSVLAEDGEYSARDGYLVVNKETGVIEHTTLMLPGAIFQCQHFSDTLASLRSMAKPADNVVNLDAIEIDEDVVPN